MITKFSSKMVTGIGTIPQGVGSMMNSVHQSPEPMKKPSDNRRVSDNINF